MPYRPHWLSLSCILFILLVSDMAGCARRIGDSCSSSTECSINGDRQCDLAQYQGYCTVPRCDPNGCPDNSPCIEFKSNIPRLARRFCMHPCKDDGECRHGYVCMQPAAYAPDLCPASFEQDG